MIFRSEGILSGLEFNDTLISFTVNRLGGVLPWFQVGGPLRFAVLCFRSVAVWQNNSGCSKAPISINEGVGEMFIILPTVMFVYQILLPSVISVFLLLPKVVILNGGWRLIFKSQHEIILGTSGLVCSVLGVSGPHVHQPHVPLVKSGQWFS